MIYERASFPYLQLCLTRSFEKPGADGLLPMAKNAMQLHTYERIGYFTERPVREAVFHHILNDGLPLPLAETVGVEPALVWSLIQGISCLEKVQYSC